ncbi:cytochrome c-type biogenesis protein [Rhodoferax lacus]|nr:cytochrome c-type biogenesis protein [Rhodoferax lacus]
MLRRFAGRCPPGGLTSLGAALREVVLLLCVSLCMSAASAAEAVPAAADPVLEARMLKIAAELRCLVCQNQTIADSHADLAIDLRQQVRELLQKGMTDQQITAYMTDRYGDFVLYRPPFKATTVLLWAGPGVMLVGGLLVLVLVLRKRSRMPEDRFDADEPPVS